MRPSELTNPVDRFWKIPRLLALLAVLALVIAACGDGGTDGGETEEPEAETEEPEAETEEPEAAEPSDEPVELTVWFARDYYVPPDNFESFQEEYPNITVNVDIIPADDIFEQMVRMKDAGEPLPDVVQGDGFFQPAMFEAEVAADITDLVGQWEEEDPESFNDVFSVVWEQGTYDGRIVSMANTAQMGQIFYRSDWFAEAGVEEFPDSWDGFLDALRAIKESNPDVHPFAMRGQPGTMNRTIEQAVAMGVEFTEEGIPQIDTEAGHYWIDFTQTLIREGLIPSDTLAWDTDMYRGAFNGSTAASIGESIGKAVDAEDAGLVYEENFLIANLPLARTSGGSEEGEQMAWFRIWNITTTSEHPYEASLVLRYLMEEENAVAMVFQGGDLPRTSSVLESEEIQSQITGFNSEFAEAFSNAGGPPLTTFYFEMEDIWELLLQDALANPDAPAEELAAKWQAEFDSLGS